MINFRYICIYNILEREKEKRLKIEFWGANYLPAPRASILLEMALEMDLDKKKRAISTHTFNLTTFQRWIFF